MRRAITQLCRPVRLGLLGKALALVLLLGLGGLTLQAGAQEAPTRQVDESGALLPRKGAEVLVQADAPLGPVNGRAATDADVGAEVSLDYTAWERIAARAETAISNRAASSVSLEHLRAQLVDWREALLGAQNANAARIATLRTQVAALGPAPGEATIEAEEIAKRRSQLTEQLVRLQAPGLAAEEAYRRADGLIREIDRVVRERQADELLQLWPSPINPGNWPEAVIGMTDTGIRLWDEVAEKWETPKARDELGDYFPLVLLFLAISVGLIWFGRAWFERLAMRLHDRASARGRKLWALVASLGEIVFPVVGVILAAVALELTQMLGVVGQEIVDTLPEATMPVILAAWLCGRVFPRGASAGPLRLPHERRVEARYNAVAMGLLLGIDQLRFAAMDSQSYSEGTTSVTSFPGLVVSGLLLVRMGQLLHRHAGAPLAKEVEAQNYGRKLLSLLGRGVMAIGVAAASALIYPAIISLGLIALLLILQELVSDLYALVMRIDDPAHEALLPVLANFAIALAMVPGFALIWGARTADLTELWTQFREGFSLGDTRISPSSFLIFAIIFAIGYTLTRMFQGGLKATILPRTSLDQGGQNAIVSGVGYIGIFFAGLIAINAAGIDLSGLAIVAGALSVGIGFGLQAVVSNFVSGIILLIERPVSEGDWIEVGTTQGIVKSISVRSTRIQTFDRSDVIVPNSDLISGRVTNWTRFNQTGRITVPVAVVLTTDSRKVERILREIIEAQPLAILNPPPIVALMGFGADTMNFEIRVILRDVNFQVPVRSEINHQIAQRFAEEGIQFSSAQRDHLRREAEAILAESEAQSLAHQHEDAVAALLLPPPTTPDMPTKRPRKLPAKEAPQ
jgi:small-conductance mechanosensitive channel